MATQEQMEKTLTGKILHDVWFTPSAEFGKATMNNSRKDFIQAVKENYGEEGEKEARRLWNEGYVGYNCMGYVVLTNRGFKLWHGNDTPKRAKKQRATTSQILDYLWQNNREDFESWLITNGKQEKQLEEKQ